MSAAQPAIKRILKLDGALTQERLDDEVEFADKVQPFLVDQSERIAQQSAFANEVPSGEFWKDEHTVLAAVLTVLLISSAEKGVSQSVALISPVGLGVGEAVNIAAEKWANRHSLSLAKGLNRTTRQMARVRMEAWIRQGGTVDQLTSSFGEIIAPRWRAEMIAQTEITRAYSEAARSVAKEVGAKRIWATANDEKTCPTCQPLDGAKENRNGVFPGGFTSPPAHPRCRCYTSFLFV